MGVLQELTEVLESRKGDDPESSYVAALYTKGTNKILEKVGEEATEVILAAKDYEQNRSGQAKAALTGEVADLWFHSLVMLAHLDLSAEDVLQALAARQGTSGHDEKANRS